MPSHSSGVSQSLLSLERDSRRVQRLVKAATRVPAPARGPQQAVRTVLSPPPKGKGYDHWYQRAMRKKHGPLADMAVLMAYVEKEMHLPRHMRKGPGYPWFGSSYSCLSDMSTDSLKVQVLRTSFPCAVVQRLQIDSCYTCCGGIV